MSNTYIHNLHAKFKGGLLSKQLPIKLQLHYDRHNFDVGYFKDLRIKKREKQADKEMFNELNNN